MRKIKKGLKTKGMKCAGYDKMQKQDNASAEYAKHDQMYGAGAKQVQCDHVAMGNKKEPK